MNAILILNDHAGSIAKGDSTALTVETIVDGFAASGSSVTVERVSGEEVVSTVRAAIKRKPSAIFVGGGDGTISSAAGLLVDTEIPLGILPLGTLNHFARDLGLPLNWRDAASVQVTASSRRVDVGEVNGRVFINNCSIGSYAQAVQRRDALRREHGHGKWYAMLRASIAVFRALHRLRFRIELPSTSLTLRAPFVVISNNRYSGRVFDSSLRPRLDEGQLWLYTTRAKKKATLLRLALQTLLRRIDEGDALESHAFSEAVVISEHGPVPVAADGEVVAMPPSLRFRARPASLTVLAPTPSAAQK